MSNYSTTESHRRSSRQRKSRSALELLGIERKKKCKTVDLLISTTVEQSEFLITNDYEPCLGSNKLRTECTHYLSHNVYSQPKDSTFPIEQANIAGIEKCCSPLLCSRSMKNEAEMANEGHNEVYDRPILERSFNMACEKQLQLTNTNIIAVNIEDKLDTSKLLTLISDEAHESQLTKVSSVSQCISLTGSQICDKGVTGSSSAEILSTPNAIISTVDGQKQKPYEKLLLDHNKARNEVVQASVVEDIHAPVTSDDLNKLLRNKAGRAVPVRHMVMGDELQQIVDKLQPADVIDDHVIYRVRKEGGKRRLMFCKYCEAQINHRHQFRSHIKSHQEVDYRPYHCPLCDYKCQIKAQIARHINIHSAAKPFFCTLCGRGFNFKQKLQIHMKYHADVRDQICPLCQMSFHEFKTLKNHVKSVHNIPEAKEFLRQRLTSLCDTGGDQDLCVNEADISPLPERINMSTGSVKFKQMVLTRLPSELPSDGANVHEQVEAAVSNVDSVSAASESSNIVLVIDGKSFSEQLLRVEDIELAKCDNGISYAVGETELRSAIPSLIHSDCANLQGNIKFEVDHSVESTPYDGTSYSSFNGQPKTSMNESQPRLLFPRRKSTIYGTCKTNIQTEIYRRSLSSPHLSLHGKARKLQKGNAVSSSRQRRPSSRVLELLRAYCCSVTSRHPDYPDREVLLACNLCSATGVTSLFPTRTLFALHLENHHPNLNAWQCDQCTFRYTAALKPVHGKITRHYSRFCAVVFYNVHKCELSCIYPGHDVKLHPHSRLSEIVSHRVCGILLGIGEGANVTISKLRSSLIVHMKGHYGYQKQMCEFCGEIFICKQKLMVHIRQHLNQCEFQCPSCHKAFNERSQLRKHVSRDHCEVQPYVCNVCNKAFKEDVQFRCHLETHEDLTKFECGICKKLYKNKVSLALHVKSHSRNFRCDVCDKEFSSYSGFMSHKVMHIESHNGYQCEKCSKLLNTKASMSRHYKVVHGSERPFACKQCPKKFKTKKDLQSHGVVHNPDKRFECTTCSFQCKRLHSLRVHMRVHFAVKPYHCVLCQRQYTQKQPLDIHIGRHVSKPTSSSCVTCGISLSSGADVVTHLRAVHNHVVDVLPTQHVGDAEQWQSVDGSSQLVMSSCDDSAHHEEVEVAAVESYVTVETVDVSSYATNDEMSDVLYGIRDTPEPVVNLVSFEKSCYQTSPTQEDVGDTSRYEDVILSQRCSEQFFSKDDNERA